jgi:DNA-binding transcriptional regulator YiaG
MSADARRFESLTVNTKECCLLHPTAESPPLADGEIEIAGKRYVTPERLAQLLGCSARTVARWDAERIGPPRIKVGKTVLYDLEKLPAWLAGRESRPIGEPN